MQITVHEIDAKTLEHLDQSENTFEVNSQLRLSFERGEISYIIVDIPPYTKQYPVSAADYNAYIDNPDKTIFFAYADGELAGQIRALKWWNGYAYIEDLLVQAKYRRQGIGRALIERAVDWAKAGGFPGIMLETQNNNVAACKLYESCGFVLGGFDVYLYRGLNPASDEIALYWYLIFLNVRERPG